MQNLLSSIFLVDTLSPYIIWGTVAIVVLLVYTGLILFISNRQMFLQFAKVSLICFVFYALIIGILLLVLEIVKHYNIGYLEENWVSKDIIPFLFIPTLITLSLALLSGLAIFITNKKFNQKTKTVTLISGVVLLISLIATLVLIAVYYSKNIVGDGYYTDESSKFSSVALYIFAVALLIISVFCAFVFARKDKKGFDSRSIATAGMCVALSFALSYIKLFEMPQGGSVTLFSMLPIMLFSYIYGMKKGLLVGVIYGLLQAVQDPYIIHPAQFLLDYPMAFALTGFAGILTYSKLFKKAPQLRFGISVILGGTFRFASHVLAGTFAFGAYSLDSGLSPFVYSLGYNSYVFVDVALILVAGIAIFSSKAFQKEVERLNPIND